MDNYPDLNALRQGALAANRIEELERQLGKRDGDFRAALEVNDALRADIKRERKRYADLWDQGIRGYAKRDKEIRRLEELLEQAEVDTERKVDSELRAEIERQKEANSEMFVSAESVSLRQRKEIERLHRDMSRYSQALAECRTRNQKLAEAMKVIRSHGPGDGANSAEERIASIDLIAEGALILYGD